MPRFQFHTSLILVGLSLTWGCLSSGSGGGGGLDGGSGAGGSGGVSGGSGSGGTSGGGGLAANSGSGGSAGAAGSAGQAGSGGAAGAGGSAGSAGSGGSCSLTVHPKLKPSNVVCCTEIGSYCNGNSNFMCKLAGTAGVCEPYMSLSGCTGVNLGGECATSADCCGRYVCYQGACTDSCELSQASCADGVVGSCVPLNHLMLGVCWPPQQAV